MAKQKIGLPMVVIVMSYRKATNLMNKKNYCIELSLKKDEVGEHKRSWVR